MYSSSFGQLLELGFGGVVLADRGGESGQRSAL